jgi:hypothetical protein
MLMSTRATPIGSIHVAPGGDHSQAAPIPAEARNGPTQTAMHRIAPSPSGIVHHRFEGAFSAGMGGYCRGVGFGEWQWTQWGFRADEQIVATGIQRCAQRFAHCGQLG